MRNPSDRSWTLSSAEDFGRAIAGVRQARNLTQSDLAELAGIRENYLAKLEAGTVTPIVLARVVRALRRMGATVTVTIGQDDGPPR